MAKNPDRLDYSVGQKLIHWLMAFLIIMDLFIAQKFGGEMEALDRIESRSDHASVGLVIAILFVIRIWLRFRYGAPALPGDLPEWQVRLAHMAHWTLYVLIGLMILSGIGSAMTANSIVSPFGLFAYGDGTGNQASYAAIRVLHEFATKAIIALIILHVIAALYHLLSKHRHLTLLMMKFWKSEKVG